MRPLHCFSAILLLACIGSVHAQTYRWTDKEGRVHYTDTPPPKTAVTREEKRLSGNVASGGDLPYATREALKKYPVKLYTTDEKCSLCDEGRAMLNKRGIPFTEIKISDDDKLAELKKLNDSGKVPVLVVGSDVRTGYTADVWTSALDRAGYPKTAAAKPQPTAVQANTQPKEETSKEP